MMMTTTTRLQHRRPRLALSPTSSSIDDTEHLLSASSSFSPTNNHPLATTSTTISPLHDNNHASTTSSPNNNHMSPRNKKRRLQRRATSKCHLVRPLMMVVYCIFALTMITMASIRNYLVSLPTTTTTTTTTFIRRLQLPEPNIDIVVPNATEWPLIHIVNTRFMQEQPLLETLGEARLRLFETFCFPTMIAQTTQAFFWIIKTDPQLAANSKSNSIFQRMVQLVQPYPNIYLVASNQNFLISDTSTGGSWRDGAEASHLLSSQIFTGNITKLHQAMALRKDRPVLETRLDADDGLHIFYLEYIQTMAKRRFLQSESSSPNWLYWCTRRHVEWHSSTYYHNDTSTQTTHTGTSKDDLDAPSRGVLNPIQHSNLCVTPGITVGYNVGTQQVPVHPHDLLYKRLYNSTACNKDNNNHNHNNNHKKHNTCLDLVEDLLFCALRSRSLTSAGMRNVPLDTKYRVKPSIETKLWQLLRERFAIRIPKVVETQTFLKQHQRQIAYENLLGQCTTGHSCKEAAKQELQQYYDLEQQE